MHAMTCTPGFHSSRFPHPSTLPPGNGNSSAGGCQWHRSLLLLLTRTHTREGREGGRCRVTGDSRPEVLWAGGSNTAQQSAQRKV